MKNIKIIIAGNNYLLRKGLESVINDCVDFELITEAQQKDELFEKLKLYQTSVLIIDFSNSFFKTEIIIQLKKKYPSLNLLGINTLQAKNAISQALELGVVNYLLTDCDKDEITEAIYKTASEEKFLCGQIVNTMLTDKQDFSENIPSTSFCNGVNITDRELDIIKCVAEGFSNKEIAEKLFLSTHTVTTHRKNIMCKLGINNTAGIVLYAVREELISPNKFLFSSEN
ncbi:MAG TPA: response regulator transcription factor [Bacteroidia bacterium]|nr:response regulator transcription factor [Bacteroidia bacterium]